MPRISLCSMLQSLRHSASAAVKCKKRAQDTSLISEKLDFQSLRHSASAAVTCKKRAQATGLISEKLDFVVPALAWPALAVYF